MLEPEPFATDSVDAGNAVKGQSLTSVPTVDKLPANVLPEQTHTVVSSAEVASIVMLILTSVQGTYDAVGAAVAGAELVRGAVAAAETEDVA